MPTALKIAIVAVSVCAFSALQCKHCNRTTNRKVAAFWHLAFGSSFVTALTAAIWWAAT